MGDKKILFLVPYPLNLAPSQRFRVELFFPVLHKKKLKFKVDSFLDEESFKILYKKGNALRKLIGVLKGFGRRFRSLFYLHRYDYVFVHREASPVGPPVFEWVIAKVFRKKIIYDFDDAIWISDSKNKMLNWIKAFWKIKWIIKWSYKVAAGNNFLAAYARKYNNSVFLLPTCVDVEGKHNQIKKHDTEKLVIGWTGSHSTLKYLDVVGSVLQKLAADNQIEVVIISNKPPSESLFKYRFIPWNEETEVEDLLNLNIGIMPLLQDKWSEGKCGFKLIQYYALGIPAVASPVGVNSSIIHEGETGFLANSDSEWSNALNQLIADVKLRQTMGEKGRKKIVEQFSIQANEGLFFGLFN